jgi:hypothetical protein
MEIPPPLFYLLNSGFNANINYNLLNFINSLSPCNKWVLKIIWKKQLISINVQTI